MPINRRFRFRPDLRSLRAYHGGFKNAEMTMNHYEAFKALHSPAEPLVLCNVWDAAGAAIVQQQGAKAVATSSASLAWSNGYPDGGGLPNEVLLSAIRRIARVCQIPLTVDIEGGYSDDPQVVAALVKELVSLGVSGINIEDGDQDSSLLCEKIKAIRSLLGENGVFINARTDVYLQELVHPSARLSESRSRSRQYLQAGADGVFIPGLNEIEDIQRLCDEIDGPLNIMSSGDSQSLTTLQQMGIARISFGPLPFIQAYSGLLPLVAMDHVIQSAEPLTYASLNGLF